MKLELTPLNEKPLDSIADNGGYTSIFRTIACIGDSLSSGAFEGLKENGTGACHDMFEYSWGQFLARMCGCKVYNMSRGGMTAKEYIEHFASNSGFWDENFASQAYVIALGVNDLLDVKQPVGTIGDVNFEDPDKNNLETFAGCYATIIQRYKMIQPRAKFFLVTMPRELSENDSVSAEHRRLMYDFADSFDRTYVIDLNQYAPVYDAEFKKSFYMRGHLNPMGYCLTAKMISSYIDYIIRHNMSDFRDVGLIGTVLHD